MRIGLMVGPERNRYATKVERMISDAVWAEGHALGLEAADLQGYEVTDVVQSKVTGATHIYLRQRYRGIPVYNAQLHINVNRDGRIISVNNSFLPGIARAVKSLAPRMQLGGAVSSAAQFSGRPLPTRPETWRA